MLDLLFAKAADSASVFLELERKDKSCRKADLNSMWNFSAPRATVAKEPVENRLACSKNSIEAKGTPNSETICRLQSKTWHVENQNYGGMYAMRWRHTLANLRLRGEGRKLAEKPKGGGGKRGKNNVKEHCWRNWAMRSGRVGMIMLIVLVAAIWRLFTRGNLYQGKTASQKTRETNEPKYNHAETLS